MSEKKIPPPPRRIQSNIYLKLFFGTTLAQVSWAIFTFAMLFFWILRADLTLVELVAFKLATPIEVSGKIQNVSPTSFEVSGTRVTAVDFTFQHQNVLYKERSYSLSPYFEIDQVVPIEISTVVTRARVQGLSMAPFGTVGIWVLFLPALAFFLSLANWPRAVKSLRLLRHGKYAPGRLKHQSYTAIEINDVPVSKYAFSYLLEDSREFWLSLKTSDDSDISQKIEPVLYLPKSPNKAILIDRIPGRPKFSHDKAVYLSKPFKWQHAWPLLILALNLAIFILVNR